MESTKIFLMLLLILLLLFFFFFVVWLPRSVYAPIVFAGLILHPRGVAKQLLRVYRDFMEHAPNEVGGGFALLTAPPDTFVPENARGKPAAALILVYVGDPQRGEEIMRPLLDRASRWSRSFSRCPTWPCNS